MSKSLGNFFRVCDVAERYDRQTIRFYFLSTHYMSPLIYGEEGFELASSSLKRIWNNYRELQAYVRDSDGIDDADELIASSKDDFIDAILNDVRNRRRQIPFQEGCREYNGDAEGIR